MRVSTSASNSTDNKNNIAYIVTGVVVFLLFILAIIFYKSYREAIPRMNPL
jgi:hypothetical protein